ncbi:MAG: hypothetical protein EOP88_07670 [Verrucomicrobiaceae bacterium]|nr:MAG: hypothetical protein EOP88_07670 [Verrucomicrobiaceae bacterium]
MIYLPFLIAPFVLPVLWLVVLRPYCIRHGKGYTPGAGVSVTLWVDWQQGGEIAREKGHTGMRVVCGFIFALQVLYFLVFALGLLLEVVAGQAP